MKSIIKCSLFSSIIIILAACGGGGADVMVGQNKPSADGARVNGLPCTQSNVDVFGNMIFATTHPINARDYGCLIVDKKSDHPVFDGETSARFEVRSSDCSGNEGFNDCFNDRSRHEINEVLGFGVVTEGRILKYKTRLYIPSQERLKPRGPNALFLAQVISNGPGGFSTPVFLEAGNDNELIARIAKVDGAPEKNVLTNIHYDRWISVDYEIKSRVQSGNIKIYIDGVKKFDRDWPTLKKVGDVNSLKLGIYNAFKSSSLESYVTQVVY